MTRSTPPVNTMTAPRAAGGVSLLEASLLFAAAAVYLVELVSGEAADPSIASMSLVVCLVFAVLLVVLGMSWLRGRSWPRSPTIVWNLLLLPAAWTLGTTSGIVFGVALAVLGVIGVVAAAASAVGDFSDTAL